MTAFTEKLDRAAGAALCEALTVAGGALIGAGAVSLVAGGAGSVPIAVGSAALMASAAGCGWDPDSGGGGTDIPPAGLDCLEGSGFISLLGYRNGNLLIDIGLIVEITNVQYTGILRGRVEGYTKNWDMTYVLNTGFSGVFGWVVGTRDGTVFSSAQGFSEGFGCETPVVPPPAPVIPPYDYTDSVDGCSLTVNVEGWATDDNGSLNPVFKIEPGAELRAVGDVIGGCNFSPVIYTGNPSSPDEPPIIRPWEPEWDIPVPGEPPWADTLRDVVGGIVGDAVDEAFEKYLDNPVPSVTYRLSSICEVDSEGTPETKVVEVSIPESSGTEAVVRRIDALIPLLQGQKDFKQPVCRPAPLAGDFRTISFKSDTVSPNGKSRLLKRLKYRSVSGIGLDALIDHWKDFVFEAGPVTVKHRGASWGTVTVWANSSNEGKRVIRHAADEAGIDPDQVGYWEVGGSSSTRLGMPGTMRINTSGGYYWITERDGPTERPKVGQT